MGDAAATNAGSLAAKPAAGCIDGVSAGTRQVVGPSQYVKLNVGGSLHYTTLGTLTKFDSMLRAMFSGRMEVLTDAEGWILIDRCGKHFGTILNYLRDGSAPLPDSAREIAELYNEAKYYLISGLIETCEAALQKKLSSAEAICRVPLITSDKECQQLIQSTSKPAVKLLINRHNNKYSYTSASDDNLLKNLEMFDRLSLRFSSRITFVKDIIGTNEICCWSFYGHGKKVAEFCCTSIVYATDKKHTKVEFPEARIYEEVLNILLYESRQLPDPELMQATSQRGAAAMQRSATAAATTTVSDDDEEFDMNTLEAATEAVFAAAVRRVHHQQQQQQQQQQQAASARLLLRREGGVSGGRGPAGGSGAGAGSPSASTSAGRALFRSSKGSSSAGSGNAGNN